MKKIFAAIIFLPSIIFAIPGIIVISIALAIKGKNLKTTLPRIKRYRPLHFTLDFICSGMLPLVFSILTIWSDELEGATFTEFLEIARDDYRSRRAMELQSSV